VTTAEQPHTEVRTSKLRNIEYEGARPSLSKQRIVHVVAGGVLVALAAAAAVAASHYWRYGSFMETTDDAYVQADSTIVSPKVSGYGPN
jgi:membrane fusion protein, multidrug efflux system